jgi:hypothetical protein
MSSERMSSLETPCEGRSVDPYDRFSRSRHWFSGSGLKMVVEIPTPTAVSAA